MPKSFVADQARHLRAPPETVLQQLTDPKHLVQWSLADAKLEPSTRGRVQLRLDRQLPHDGSPPPIHGEKVRLFSVHRQATQRAHDRNGGIVPGRTNGEGTLLKLRHSGFAVPEHFAECSSRWAYYLTNLKSVRDHGTDLRSGRDS